MTSDRSDKRSHRIPIRFSDADDESSSASSTPDEMDRFDPDNEGEELSSEVDALAADDPHGEARSVSISGGIKTVHYVCGACHHEWDRSIPDPDIYTRRDS